MTRPPLTTVYDATVTPSHGAKLLPALAAQFGKAAVTTHYFMTAKGTILDSAKGANRMRIVVQVPA